MSVKQWFTMSDEERHAKTAARMRPFNERSDRMMAKTDNRLRKQGKAVGAGTYQLPENFAGMALGADTISLDGETRSLAGVTATLDVSGNINRRITATRLVATGVLALAWRKAQDDRELWLLVDGPDFQWVMRIAAKGEAAARAYAARINTAARGSRPAAS